MLQGSSRSDAPARVEHKNATEQLSELVLKLIAFRNNDLDAVSTENHIGQPVARTLNALLMKLNSEPTQSLLNS